MKVTFTKVGREEKTWTAEMPSLFDYVLRKEIRARKALASGMIDFRWDSDGTKAMIVVGGVRIVGHLSVEGGAKVL